MPRTSLTPPVIKQVANTVRKALANLYDGECLCCGIPTHHEDVCKRCSIQANSDIKKKFKAWM